eukprot:6560537-Prymnesium_polylepis.1
MVLQTPQGPPAPGPGPIFLIHMLGGGLAQAQAPPPQPRAPLHGAVVHTRRTMSIELHYSCMKRVLTMNHNE